MTTLARYTKKFADYLRHNRAVSALEYAILVGAIAVAMAGALAAFSDQLTTALNNIGTSIKATTVSTPQPTGTN